MRLIIAVLLTTFGLLTTQSARASDPNCGQPPAGALTSGYLTIAQNNNPTPIIVTNDASGTSLSFYGCLQYAPPTPFYKGSINIVYFDTAGRFLASAGQQLFDTNDNPLKSGSDNAHSFGAEVALRYFLSGSDVVSENVLIETTIYECTTQSLCADTPSSYLMWFNTDNKIKPRHAPRIAGNCARPTVLSDGEHPALYRGRRDDLFRLFADGLMSVVDDKGQTYLGVDVCLRLLSVGRQADEATYSAQGKAYFFDLYGGLIDSGVLWPAVGAGQQLGTLDAPHPNIVGDEGHDAGNSFFYKGAAIHDFAGQINVPLQDHGSIDRHVLVAINVQCLSGACKDTNPHTYYRVVDTCAPDLPDPTNSILPSHCPDFAPGPK